MIPHTWHGVGWRYDTAYLAYIVHSFWALKERASVLFWDDKFAYLNHFLSQGSGLIDLLDILHKTTRSELHSSWLDQFSETCNSPSTMTLWYMTLLFMPTAMQFLHRHIFDPPAWC